MHVDDNTWFALIDSSTNGYGMVSSVTRPINVNINGGLPTINNVLKNSGYKIFGKVPSILFLDSLYSEFEDEDKFSVEKQWPRLDDGIGEAIIKKLKTNLENPWFYYIHLLDVHSKITPGMAPLVIPQKFDTEQFGKSKYA